ncbi:MULTISPECIES: methionine ABC transporter permease [unclassified Brevibacillus]|jgi:D-methionine transport system permease protein|uniref:methionine ABC transporter permease n=1 Tax=Brevibacillus TaxID=55080 RepID=UPI00027137E1|nr:MULTISPECIES: methionine ABC transporter permease [unclassified Brevibacillus]EJL28418.1 ABC-type metal ion transport system, permease component [Brevibacillus sp. BC25]MDC0764445.1 ABC transporter permease [Brevibacillus sp. AG]MED1914330.1 ABC transporter permease [Bacillus thuringiensis]UED74639.1 ABC transporter permease [Brevibacillus sp. DP1.3A]
MDWTFENVDWAEIGVGTMDTLTMLGFSTLFTVLIGLPLGIILFLTSRGQLLQNRTFYTIASFVVNVLRSVPFIILMILLIPVTKMIVGTSLGVLGAIPPLVFGAAPFFARLVETSLREIDKGVIEAAQSMGASNWQIVWNVLLPESRSGLIAGITITTVTLVSYTAMSGVIGGGGLGDLAIRYGYQRFQTDVMIVTVVILLVMVQILQSLGDRLVLKFSRK